MKKIFPTNRPRSQTRAAPAQPQPSPEERIQAQRAEAVTRWPGKVLFTESFHDGTLDSLFLELGQDPHVRKGETRTLPPELRERVIQSGGKIEPVL